MLSKLTGSAAISVKVKKSRSLMSTCRFLIDVKDRRVPPVLTKMWLCWQMLFKLCAIGLEI